MIAWLVSGCYGTRLYRMGLGRWIVSRLEEDGSGMMCWVILEALTGGVSVVW